MARRNRQKIFTAFKRSSMSSEVPCSRGALESDQTRSVLSPKESFEPAISNRCGWVSLNIWESPKRQHGSSPQSSGKVLLCVFSLRLNEQCQSLPCGLRVVGCPPKSASSLSTWRKLLRSVLSSIHGLADIVAKCSAAEISNLKLAWY